MRPAVYLALVDLRLFAGARQGQCCHPATDPLALDTGVSGDRSGTLPGAAAVVDGGSNEH